MRTSPRSSRLRPTVPRPQRAGADALSGWGGRRGTGRWERCLTSLTEWTFVADLLPRGRTTKSDEYRALHRALDSHACRLRNKLADAGLIQMVRLPKGRKRAAVGPLGQPFDWPKRPRGSWIR